MQTQKDWQQRQKDIWEMLHNLVGPFPGKTPLIARIERMVEMDFYHMEHIVYESMPGFYVTSLSYLPENRNEKYPAIVYLSGHAQEGYRSESITYPILPRRWIISNKVVTGQLKQWLLIAGIVVQKLTRGLK